MLCHKINQYDELLGNKKVSYLNLGALQFNLIIHQGTIVT